MVGKGLEYEDLNSGSRTLIKPDTVGGVSVMPVLPQRDGEVEIRLPRS